MNILRNHVPRQFGRNISNIDRKQQNSLQVKQNKPNHIPRAKATISVYQESLIQNENQPPQGYVEQKVSKSKKDSKTRKPLQPITNVEDEMNDPMLIEDESSNSNIIYDIDSQEKDNPQCLTEYINEIFDYLKEKEIDCRIPFNYMEEFQQELEIRHREILINWICEVYLQLKLLSETLFLAVNIVDRLLSCRTVTKRKLHLVGLGALMIASKFEETYAPPVSDLRICSENAYTENEMFRVERVILNALDFNLCIPTPLQFLRRYSKAAQSDSITHTLAKYIAELTVTCYEMIEFLPSHIAASSVIIARRMQNQNPLWCPSLLHYAKVSPQEIYPCIQKLNLLLFNTHQRERGAIYRKYSDLRLYSVSKITPVMF